MRHFSRLFPGFAILVTALASVAASGTVGIAVSGRPLAAELTAQANIPPSLQQRRLSARQEQIRETGLQCRTAAQQLDALKNRPCATGDRLDARTGLCYPPKNVWMPYIRWDPAAGRCKPRDSFDGGSCVASRQRYNPGKRFAQSPSQSISMYGHAPAQLQKKLAVCRRAADGMKQKAAIDRARNARICQQARALNRADLVKLYCK